VDQDQDEVPDGFFSRGQEDGKRLTGIMKKPAFVGVLLGK
jgi:hypothetical protein